MQSELVRQSAKSEMSTNEGEREGATEEKRDNSLSGGAGKLLWREEPGHQHDHTHLCLNISFCESSNYALILYSISSYAVCVWMWTCADPTLPSRIERLFSSSARRCKIVVYQPSREAWSAFAIYPKVLALDLSATMEIKLSRDISFSRVCNGPVEARGYTFMQQHIKKQKIFIECLFFTTPRLFCGCGFCEWWLVWRC